MKIYRVDRFFCGDGLIEARYFLCRAGAVADAKARNLGLHYEHEDYRKSAMAHGWDDPGPMRHTFRVTEVEVL